MEDIEVAWAKTESGLILYLEQEQIQNPEQFDLGTPKLVFSNYDAPSVCGLYIELGSYNSERGWQNDILLGEGSLSQDATYEIVGLSPGEYSLLAESCKESYTLGVGNTFAYSGKDITLTLHDPGNHPSNGFKIANKSSKDICEAIISTNVLDAPVNVLTPNSIIKKGYKHTFGITQGLFADDISVEISVIACDGSSFSVEELAVPNWEEPVIEVTDDVFEN